MIRNCKFVILSSYSAKRDLEDHYPRYAFKARVLQFVADTRIPSDLPDLSDLQRKYSFTRNYFHVPNQFWQHKNHKVILDALKILKGKGRNDVLVVATGNTNDYRQPDHFQKLMSYAEESGIKNQFLVLGMVSYPDLIALMKYSVSIINPSLFEGWSTTVEESKSLNKEILLSNINVHQEQNPPKGLFFNPRDPNSLANLMEQVLDGKLEEIRNLTDLQYSLEERKIAFAVNYEGIIEETMIKR
jgi:glycosyltransferase involved in cell wall biosynthesis